MKPFRLMSARPACCRRGAVGVAVAVAVAVAGGLPAAAGEPLQYNVDIRPILAEACFACHGPDSASREADLRLDQRDVAIEMGAITPGAPAESEMLSRITSTDPEEKMPPPETKKTLTEAQRQQLFRWVREGAVYQAHWSLIPPRRPRPPDVRDRAWVRNPIDQFIAARLESAGLTPAPEADRRTLARRLSLDITGLPPGPETVDQFVHDADAGAYERLVDKLLESKHWGEHRGRYWLDYARYADTHGFHFDNYREMWTYRDWVIDALNRNMPFDEFTIENLAGDLLPSRTLAQQIGSGFQRCNMTTNEGGIIDEEYLVLYTRDRTETTARVWLGLTAGCAVCHDHKFDPLSQREFYQMAAFFNNTTQGARDGNIKNTPPVVAIPRAEDQARWEELPGRIAQAKQQVESRRREARPEFDRWLAAATPQSVAATIPSGELYLHARLDEGEGKIIGIEVDGAARQVPLTDSASWQTGRAGQALETDGAACALPDAGDFAKDQAFTCAVWIKLPDNDQLYEFWLGTLDDPFKSSRQELAQLEQEHGAIEARGTVAYVMQEKAEPATAYVLHRGEYDKRGDQVTPDTPAALPPLPQSFPRNRLGLARWLLLPEHPLTARVTVNRFWQEVFGTGMVKTAGDFGVAGQLPSHPELLDWLAVEFRESGWDVKKLFKLMVTSATYRQAAVTTPEKLAKDPANRLLARGPRFRMDAEMVRDYALAASRLLVPTIGGPSVKPYQPPGVWEAIAMNVSNTRSYQRGSGADLYRRSLYTFVKRMAPPASMSIFNAPSREVCMVVRARTNTPLQALVTLNDEQFVEAARHLARHALQEGGEAFEQRLQVLGLRLLAREFRPAETEVIRRSLRDLSAFYDVHPDDAKRLIHVGESTPDSALPAPTLAAWTMLANQLMNLDEVLNK